MVVLYIYINLKKQGTTSYGSVCFRINVYYFQLEVHTDLAF